MDPPPNDVPAIQMRNVHRHSQLSPLPCGLYDILKECPFPPPPVREFPPTVLEPRHTHLLLRDVGDRQVHIRTCIEEALEIIQASQATD